ncbi:hypothetical protein Tco_0937777 [Tanacetum coccineum]|uniref:Uncharacterized protein n=1 Tax=Tanacetum coccineum TaxID=301880 RepID=A0ABQ5DG88_9ASTR
MMMCKQAKQGVPLRAEQADWLEDTDEEIDEQELEAHYSYMAKIQEVSPAESSSTDTPWEQVDKMRLNLLIEPCCASNVIANLTLDTEGSGGGSSVGADSSMIALQSQTDIELVMYRTLMTYRIYPIDSLIYKQILPDGEEAVTLENESRSILIMTQ